MRDYFYKNDRASGSVTKQMRYQVSTTSHSRGGRKEPRALVHAKRRVQWYNMFESFSLPSDHQILAQTYSFMPRTWWTFMA